MRSEHSEIEGNVALGQQLHSLRENASERISRGTQATPGGVRDGFYGRCGKEFKARRHCRKCRRAAFAEEKVPQARPRSPAQAEGKTASTCAQPKLHTN